MWEKKAQVKWMNGSDDTATLQAQMLAKKQGCNFIKTSAETSINAEQACYILTSITCTCPTTVIDDEAAVSRNGKQLTLMDDTALDDSFTRWTGGNFPAVGS